MQCSNCGMQNEEGYKFCMKCGSALLAHSAEAQAIAQPISPQPIPMQQPQPSPQIYVSTQPTPQPVQQSQSSYQAYQPKPDYNQSLQSAAQFGQKALAYGSQGISSLHFWGPFAGYGTRRKHIGWLMDNRGDKTQDLIDKVNEQFTERQIPEANVSHAMLTARGLIVENRPYFILRKGLASVGLYIAQFGRDLYISIASYLKPPISNFRVLLLIVMVLFFLFMTISYPAMLSSEIEGMLSSIGGSFLGGSSSTGDGLLSLLCFIGPLGTINTVALLLFVVYGIFKWLSEKDFWAGLRVQPNEFNEDDLMAMEKAVQQTVELSMDMIGLDPADLKQVESGFSNRLI